MKRKKLGLSGLEVSVLCFGTLTVSPLQKNFPPAQAAELFCYAREQGINFFDTAEIYDTYEPLGLALKRYPDLVIATKCYAVTAQEMQKSIELARRRLDRDYIDIFCLHEVENAATFKGHRGALEYLYKAKASGIIKAVGISTHTVAGVRAGATEPGIDVIHPLINRAGIGIRGGTAADMVAALRTAKEFGKGIYAMKALAGGHLSGNATSAIAYVRNLQCVDSIAIGMQSVAEIQCNSLLVENQPVPPELQQQVTGIERHLQIASWCKGCGLCVAQCNFGALQLNNGKLVVDVERCLRCGYCARVCPDFCLKIV
ncbi:MAG TPA: aldo/keto reductase [Bacillota bacterium]